MVSTLRSDVFPEYLSITTCIYCALLSILLYYIFDWIDLYDFIIKIAWSTLVFLIPTRLVSTLDSDFLAFQTNGDGGHQSTEKYQMEKSNAILRILHLDNGGILNLVHRTRALSNAFQQRSTKLPGLGNWDNSCYQNSVLQGLASIQSLLRFLGSPPNTKADTTRASLLNLAFRLNDEGSRGSTLWTPAKLKNMSSWQQQDAQEYFSKVLDEVDKDTVQALAEERRKRFQQGFATTQFQGRGIDDQTLQSDVGSADKKLRSQFNDLPTEVRSLVLHNPLEGLLAQRVGCQRCGYVEGLSLVPFTCLTVPLGTDLFYDIRECLNEFTALESIDGVECAKCTLLQAQRSMYEILKSIRPSTLKAAEAVSSQQETLAQSIQERLSLVEEALEHEDFSEACLKRCQISNKSRVSSTKSRQAVIGRAPPALALHVNRSQFDEITGMQTKNYAKVRFPLRFNLGSWYLGQGLEQQAIEEWETNPSVSMLPPFDAGEDEQLYNAHLQYQLRAVVTHYGRHENGHYICYRQAPGKSTGATEKGEDTTWWQLSDQHVFEVTQEEMLDQGGVFMLFYEQVEPSITELSRTAGPDAIPTEGLAGPKLASAGAVVAAATVSEDLRSEGVINVEKGHSPQTPTSSDFVVKKSTVRLQQSVPQALPTPPPSPKLAATLAPMNDEQI